MSPNLLTFFLNKQSKAVRVSNKHVSLVLPKPVTVQTSAVNLFS